MPLTRSLLKGKPPEYRQAILDGLFDVPEDDRFMTIDEYDSGNFLYSENYLGIVRDDDLVIVQITVNNTRGPEQKKRCSRASRNFWPKTLASGRKIFW
jgi:4-oxalocrotonate tautomerase